MRAQRRFGCFGNSRSCQCQCCIDRLTLTPRLNDDTIFYHRRLSHSIDRFWTTEPQTHKMHPAGIAILVIILLLIAAGVGWIVLSRIRAQRLGVCFLCFSSFSCDPSIDRLCLIAPTTPFEFLHTLSWILVVLLVRPNSRTRRHQGMVQR